MGLEEGKASPPCGDRDNSQECKKYREERDNEITRLMKVFSTYQGEADCVQTMNDHFKTTFGYLGRLSKNILEWQEQEKLIAKLNTVRKCAYPVRERLESLFGKTGGAMWDATKKRTIGCRYVDETEDEFESRKICGRCVAPRRNVSRAAQMISGPQSITKKCVASCDDYKKAFAKKSVEDRKKENKAFAAKAELFVGVLQEESNGIFAYYTDEMKAFAKDCAKDSSAGQNRVPEISSEDKTKACENLKNAKKKIPDDEYVLKNWNALVKKVDAYIEDSKISAKSLFDEANKLLICKNDESPCTKYAHESPGEATTRLNCLSALNTRPTSANFGRGSSPPLARRECRGYSTDSDQQKERFKKILEAKRKHLQELANVAGIGVTLSTTLDQSQENTGEKVAVVALEEEVKSGSEAGEQGETDGAGAGNQLVATGTSAASSSNDQNSQAAGGSNPTPGEAKRIANVVKAIRASGEEGNVEIKFNTDGSIVFTLTQEPSTLPVDPPPSEAPDTDVETPPTPGDRTPDTTSGRNIRLEGGVFVDPSNNTAAKEWIRTKLKEKFQQYSSNDVSDKQIDELAEAILEEARREHGWGIARSLAKMESESGFKVNVKGGDGFSSGLMQIYTKGDAKKAYLMELAKEFGIEVTPPFDIQELLLKDPVLNYRVAVAIHKDASNRKLLTVAAREADYNVGCMKIAATCRALQEVTNEAEARDILTPKWLDGGGVDTSRGWSGSTAALNYVFRMQNSATIWKQNYIDFTQGN